jgi:hypothetical protein
MFRKTELLFGVSGRQEGFPSYSWAGWKHSVTWSEIYTTISIKDYKSMDTNDLAEPKGFWGLDPMALQA